MLKMYVFVIIIEVVVCIVDFLATVSAQAKQITHLHATAYSAISPWTDAGRGFLIEDLISSSSLL